MNTYNKAKTITFNGEKFIVDAWDTSGFVNSCGVSIDRIINDGGFLLRFNSYEEGESGERTFISCDKYEEIADGYDCYDELNTWTRPFLEIIGR